MAYLQLQTGKTISISTYEFLFKIPDDKVDEFFQQCIADDLGEFIENPFSSSASLGRIKLEEEEIDELPDEIELPDNEFDMNNE